MVDTLPDKLKEVVKYREETAKKSDIDRTELNKDKNGNYLIEHFFLNIVLNNSVIVDNKKLTIFEIDKSKNIECKIMNLRL